MRTIARTAAIAAPFIVVVSLASVGFAEEPDLMQPLSPSAHVEDLDVNALDLGPDQGTFANSVAVTSAVPMSLAGATGSGPSALPGKAGTGNWIAEPIKG